MPDPFLQQFLAALDILQLQQQFFYGLFLGQGCKVGGVLALQHIHAILADDSSRALQNMIQTVVVLLVLLLLIVAFNHFFLLALALLLKSNLPPDQMYIVLSEYQMAYFLGSNSECLKMLRWSPRWVLWKSYMLSCLTKEENLLWRKYLGKMISSNFFWLRILMPLCSVSQ